MANYRGKFKGVIDGILTLPLILPPTVVGFFLLLICGKNGPIGKLMILFDKSIIFSWSATVIAAVVVSFPMMYRSALSSFEQIATNLIFVARTLGLSEYKIVNFESKNGVLGLLGESGSGKSMTLKCISGLITPDKGKIILNKKIFFDSEKNINLSPQIRNTGYLFQNYALFPTMKIKDNIKIGLTDMTKDNQNLLMKEYIKKFNLLGLEDRYPWQLSGGQMQRVALARSLIKSPDILLLDEPFSALDMHLRNNIEKELLSIIKDFNKTFIFVTHNIGEAYRICDEIIVYENGRSLKKEINMNFLVILKLFQKQN